MHRWFFPGCAIVLCTVFVSALKGDDDPAPPDIPSMVRLLITRLDNVDPVIRLDSQQRLINLGETARPALRLALRTASMPARRQIDGILLHIPWVDPGDSDDVKRAFVDYSNSDSETRCELVENFRELFGPNTGKPLMRILLCDPSASVRWQAADSIRFQLLIADPTDQQSIDLALQLIDFVDGGPTLPHTYLPADQNAPLLAIAGWTLREKNTKRCRELMEKALAIETNHPSAFRGQINFVNTWLATRAAIEKNFARMMLLLREQADRSSFNAFIVPEAVTQLFVAQADYGPFPGFQEDLQTYLVYFSHPEMLYSLGRLLEKQNHPVVSAAVDAFAFSMSGASPWAHYQAGEFLVQHQWDDQAERELKWALHLTDGKSINAYFYLSELEEHRDDDLAAANYLETGLKLLQSGNARFDSTTIDLQFAKVHWHYLRAYRQLNDQTQMQSHLDKLLELDDNIHVLQKDPGLAADIVPALQQLGRTPQADQIFNTAFSDIQKLISASPDDPMPKNNIAWLCASSGKRLDDAVRYADQAVALVPDDSACLDTQAEAYFRVGRLKESVQIEQHALAGKPTDVYMQRQLKRFREAAEKVAK